MPGHTSTCCNAQCVCDNGFMCCTACGCVQNRALDVSITSFEECKAPHYATYTRSRRFRKNILACLTNRVCHNVDTQLAAYLKRCAKTPEEYVQALSNYPTLALGTSRRRPYIHLSAYWVANGNVLPRLSANHIARLTILFDSIFFAWARLGLPSPQFPYTTLLQMICAQQSGGDALKFIIRFTRVLRCPKRRTRYANAFNLCMSYIKDHGEIFQGGDSRKDARPGIEPIQVITHYRRAGAAI